MAIMINCAHDWTFDLFVDDLRNGSDDEYRSGLVSWAKRLAEKYPDGDELARILVDADFSDYYKDAYGQRPHLPMWYYIHALGVSHEEDLFRSWGSDAFAEACKNARGVRAELERRAY